MNCHDDERPCVLLVLTPGHRVHKKYTLLTADILEPARIHMEAMKPKGTTMAVYKVVVRPKTDEEKDEEDSDDGEEVELFVLSAEEVGRISRTQAFMHFRSADLEYHLDEAIDP